MNKRVKKLWIKALRSGEYKQGRLRLKSGDGDAARHCCLGVLCEIAIQKGVITKFAESAAVPPVAVIQWAGLEKDGDPVLGRRRVKEGTPSATRLNDGGYTFRQIAERIEKYL